MAQLDDGPAEIDPANFNKILDKTQKLSAKIQQQKKRVAPTKTKPENVKRMKLPEPMLKKPSPKQMKSNGKFENGNKKNGFKGQKDVKQEDADNKKGLSGKGKFDGKPKIQPEFGQNGEKTNWKVYKAEKKKLKKFRQEKKNTPQLQSSIEDANRLWTSLLLKSNTKSVQKSVAVELLGVLKDSILKCVWKHDTSRYLQALISKGPPEVVDTVYQRLKDEIVPIAKGKYSHWCVIRLLEHGSSPHKRAIIKSLEGEVCKLMKSSIACKVLEEAYIAANASEKTRIMQEFYSPVYRFAKDDTIKSLQDVIDKTPEKRADILSELARFIKKLITKNRWRLTTFHALLYEYVSVADDDGRNEMLTLTHPNILDILHTKPGAKLAMTCFWKGDKKVRKQLVKSLKGKVVEICIETQGHRVLLAIFDSVDDTTLVSKAIIQEISSNFSAIMTNDIGRRVILYLCAGREGKFFDPATVEILSVGDGNQFTKKPINDIHAELRSSLEPALVTYLKENISDFLQDNKSALYLKLLLDSVSISSRASLYESIADVIVSKTWEEIFALKILWKLFVGLVRSSYTEDVEKLQKFPEILNERLTPDVIKKWSKTLEGKALLFRVMLATEDKDNKNFITISKIFQKFISGRKEAEIVEELSEVRACFDYPKAENSNPEETAAKVLKKLKSLGSK